MSLPLRPDLQECLYRHAKAGRYDFQAAIAWGRIMSYGTNSSPDQIRSSLERLAIHDHVCLIYETLEEQLSATLAFMRPGLDRGERCILLAEEGTVSAVLTAMARETMDPSRHRHSG
jgi:hypothetical protein